MEFLKKRRNAFIIAVAAVILSILFGSVRSAGAEAQRVTDQFSSGNGSIYSQLQMRCNSAMNMYSIAANYSGSDLESAAENFRSSRNNLLALMETDAGASALYEANETLQSAGDGCYKLLSSRDEISKEDLKNLDSDYNIFINAQRVIGDSDYNKAVKEFNKSVLSIFPLSLLRNLITTPELFS